MTDPERPRFTLIEGGGQRPSSWLSPPTTVIGKSPFDKNRIMSYRVASGDLTKHVAAGRRQPIFDLWWNVHGEVPPVPGAERYGDLEPNAVIGLRGAHACFRGLMRPAGEDDRGFDFVAFVTKPSITFKYEPSMACVIKPAVVPEDLVFLIYAKLDFPEGRRHDRKHGILPVTDGTVILWQFVECAPGDPFLPADHETRFRRRLW